MPDLRLPLTDRNVAGLPSILGAQYRARDTELAGFFVLIGSRTKSFMIQGDLRLASGRRSVRMKVADVGELSAREARAKAKALLGAIGDGVDPRQTTRAPNELKMDECPSLRRAWERYRDSHLLRKKRSDKTVAHYRDHLERLFVEWLDQPLTRLGDDPRLVADRHDAISRDNGPAIANAAMRSLRAVYNHARKTCRRLPAENPTFAVDWNPEKRRDTGMGVRDLPGWFEQAAALDNPIRKEFHLLSLLSGCRPDALKRVRLVDVDMPARILHVPKPKGGETKAFDIPLSRPMLESILRLRRFGPILYPIGSQTWLFPSDARSGHLEEHKEDRHTGLSHWGNDLRQSYRTLGQVAGVSDMDMHLLMNHSLPGVNAGYITRSKLMADHLRQQQERISKLIITSVVGRGKPSGALLARWLNSTSRAQLADLLSADPDVTRGRVGARSALRKLEIQAARCAAQRLESAMLDAPSRRRRCASTKI